MSNLPSENVYIGISDAAALLHCPERTIRRHCAEGKYPGAQTFKNPQNGHDSWQIPLDDLMLSRSAKIDYLKSAGIQPSDKAELPQQTDQLSWYQSQPAWQRQYIDKNLDTVKRIEELRGLEFSTECMAIGISASTGYRLLQDYREHGIRGLIKNFGHSKGMTDISPEARDFYDSAAFKPGIPPLATVYRMMIGYLRKNFPDQVIPSEQNMRRDFYKRYTQSEIDYRRKGAAYYQQRWQYYIDRDLNDIEAGKGWYADSHLCKNFVITDDGRKIKPWITVFCDVRTGKFLSVHVFDSAPSIDNTLYAFYLAVEKYGLPDWVYFDHGSEFQNKEISGKNKAKSKRLFDDEADRIKTRSILHNVGVEVIFAQVRKPQGKTLERWFRPLIDNFARIIEGFTASNYQKRPESTDADVRAGRIQAFTEYKELLIRHIENTYNNQISNGKLCQGMTHNIAFETFRCKEIRTLSEDSVQYLLMRSSKEYLIGKNGIHFTEMGADFRYWGDWMHGKKKTNVYLRRHPEDYNVAWVFNASDDTPMGCAYLDGRVPFRGDTPLAKEAIAQQMERRNRDEKLAREKTRPKIKISARDAVEYQEIEASDRAREHTDMLSESASRSVQIQTTPMDVAKKEHERYLRTGTDDICGIVPEAFKKREIFVFECEKEEAENG
jgi:hypothetical protein